MYKAIVEKYVKNLDFDTFKSYVSKNYDGVLEYEVKIIYDYIKNRWLDIYNEDKSVLLELKKEVSENTFLEVEKLLDSAYKFKNR